MTATSRPLRVVLVVTEDWHYCSHRLPLGAAAVRSGIDFTVAARVQAHGDVIRASGARLEPLRLRRGSARPWAEVRSILELRRLYRRLRPDIVHHVALKPVLYGTLAARLAGVPVVVNAVAGLGFTFSSESLLARVLRPVVRGLYRLALARGAQRVILQNPDDVAYLTAHGMVRAEQVVLIRGSGVDLERFRPSEPPAGDPVVLLPARLLVDKGVREFAAAAVLARARGLRARWVLVGASDAHNPAAVPEDEVRGWVRDGALEWWGQRDDMPAVYAAATIVCLPSYREGVPKALLEAAASGRALVATDVPGCREIVRHDVTGLLVPPKNAEAITDAVERLLTDAALRARCAATAREVAVQEFAVETVVARTLEIYRTLEVECASP